MNRCVFRFAFVALFAAACSEPPPPVAPAGSPEPAAVDVPPDAPPPHQKVELDVTPAPPPTPATLPPVQTTEMAPGESSVAPAAVAVAKPYKNGDVIFHDANTEQSELVRMVTRSRWTHLGILWNEPEGVVVFEAAAPVKKTPLDAWTRRGVDNQYVVKRPVAGIEQAALERMHASMTSWLGRPYDYRFQWGDEVIYCSEFVYKVFERAGGGPLGKKQKAREMALDDPVIQLAIKSRWGKATYNPEEPVVTPDSIFNDPSLVEVER